MIFFVFNPKPNVLSQVPYRNQLLFGATKKDTKLQILQPFYHAG